MKLHALLLAAAIVAAAQHDPFALYQTSTRWNAEKQKLLSSTDSNVRRETAIDLLKIDRNVRAFSYSLVTPEQILAHNYQQLIKAFEEARFDEQVGTNPNSTGTTSLVSKGSAPAVLGFAVEAGALTRTIDGSTATFRANGEGLVRFLLGQEMFPYCPIGDGTCKPTWANNLDLSFTFDASRGEGQTVEATPAEPAAPNAPAPLELRANRRQFSSATIRYAISNPRDVRSDAYKQKWLNWLTTNNFARLRVAGQNLSDTTARVFDSLERNEQFSTEFQTATAQLAARATAANFDAEFRAAHEKLVLAALEVDPTLRESVLQVLRAYDSYFSSYRQLIADINSEPVWSAEYTYSEPLNQPKLHNARLIWTAAPKKGLGALTANLAATWYHSAQPTVGRWRDIQAAAQFDRPVGNYNSNPLIFSLAAYYQYMANDAAITIGPGETAPGTGIVLPGQAATLLAPKGNIFIGQAKVTLRLKDSGVGIPFAVSWSNRTELLKASEVRGHIGLTFDVDTLFMGRRPGPVN